jgi:hypothetical protein
MREIRLSGSEGGGTELNRFSLPLSHFRPYGPAAACCRGCEMPNLDVKDCVTGWRNRDCCDSCPA